MPLEGDGSIGYLPEMEQEEPRLSGKVPVLRGASSRVLVLSQMLPVVDLVCRAGPGTGCGFVKRSRSSVQAGGMEEGETSP